MKIRPLLALCALVVAFAALGCTSAPAPSSQASTLGSIAATNPNLSTFMDLARSAGIERMLTGPSPLTLLAPTNDAFAALPPDQLAGLARPENKDRLTAILRNHILAGGSSLDQLATMTGTLAPQSLTGSTLNVEQARDGSLVVGGAKVTETIKTGNGYVHMVDRVLLPQ